MTSWPWAPTISASDSARGNDEELTPLGPRLIGHGHGHAWGRQVGVPELLSCFHVQCPQAAVHGRSNEDQAAGRDDGATNVGSHLSAGVTFKGLQS